MEREGLSHSDLTLRPHSSRGLRPVLALPRLSPPGSPLVPRSNHGLQPVLDVRESKGNRVPGDLAALPLAVKYGSTAIEAMKVYQVGKPAVLRPAGRRPLPAVEGPGVALRAAADLASKR